MPKNVVSNDIKISEKYTSVERKAIARDVIDYIVKRTKSGRGEGDRPWSGSASSYSKSYQQSLDFKQKKDKSKVNLELSGDMLTSVKTLDDSKGEITIGIKIGESEWSRGKGNILGTYGQKKPIPGKQRPFLNLTKKEVKAILSDYPIRDTQKRAESVLSSTIVNDLSTNIINQLKKKAKQDESE